METKNTPKYLQTASQVWNALKNQGGLDEEFYDSEIISDLRARLFLPTEGDFSQALLNRSVAVEDFIVAFFQAIQPYAEMMSDLLAMFEKAGAKRADNNLAIEFNFEPNLPPLNFDLEHFRESLYTWKSVTGTLITSIWEPQNLWGLNRALHADWNAAVNDQQFRHWNHEYRDLGRWPKQILPPPRSQDPDLDAAFSRVWQLWASFVSACMQYGNNQQDVVNARYRSTDETLSTQESTNVIQTWPLSVIGSVESDFWAGSLARSTYYLAERMATLPFTERSKEADILRAKIDNVFNQLPAQEIEKDVIVKSLLDLLNLPLWRKRHELYSAWISTQLVNAIPGPVRIHHWNGRLVFSFSGTHLATADTYEPRLHIWAELRSPLADPRGKSRTKAIQPDYSLITDPVSNPEASILEVECKQYRRPSTRNFTDALIDYAKGRPNAQILLVNYGRANQAILEKVDANVRNRTYLIGDMRPSSIAAQELFKEIIQEAIRNRYSQSIAEDTSRPSIDIQHPAQVVLSWGSKPRDLDLYLRINLLDQEYETNFQKKGNLDMKPWIQLDSDVTSGSGPERIQIKQWLDGRYHFAVHNYSGDWPLAGCGAKLTIISKESEWEIVCPSEGIGEWWKVLEIDGSTGQIDIINVIIGHPS